MDSRASNDEGFRGFFRKLTALTPHDYQISVARRLLSGDNVLLRAPTGAGKTWAVIAPFLSNSWKARPARLIYALPLRTLVHGVYHQARRVAQKLGHPIEPILDEHQREKIPPFVTIQTGEQPDDPFFSRGTIVVTTYDQVLSGLLDGPYGLSPKLHNINAAAVAGALVVFDEFHLMPPAKAFLTAAACLNSFRDLCQSVWMTATATTPLRAVLSSALKTVEIPADGPDLDKMVAALDSVTTVSRQLQVERDQLTARSVLDKHQNRSIVLLNTVERAQVIYCELHDELARRASDTTLTLLHSRFFKAHREQKETLLRERFGPGATSNAILVATQVVEAGIDISCERLHTELCPINSLVQRAGRCARFCGESGVVHVYPLPDTTRSWLPYGTPSAPDPTMTRTRQLLDRIGAADVTPQTVAEWVEAVHAEDDAMSVRDPWEKHQQRCAQRIQRQAILRDAGVGVADLIRGDDDDSIRVIVADNPPETPARLDGLNLRRGTLASKLGGRNDAGWFWDYSQDIPSWSALLATVDLQRSYVVCLSKKFARYEEEVGLILGEPGTTESPARKPIPRPGHYTLREETWTHHARAVAEEAESRLERDFPFGGLLHLGLLHRYKIDYPALREAVRATSLLHDLGKLQARWQHWAEEAMSSRQSGYVLNAPLAHTIFNPDSREDLEHERNLQRRGIGRPAHAAASALYAWPIINQLVSSSPAEVRSAVGTACLGAILGHHGGWTPERSRFSIDNLTPRWEEALRAVLGDHIELSRLPGANRQIDPHGKFSGRMDVIACADEFADWWPLMSLLTRILRLSDQRATAEAHLHD